MHETSSLIFTGERYLPEIGGAIHAEHLHRYLLARRLAGNRDVLDVASGEGYGSALLAEVARTVIGVDIDEEAITHATAKYSRPNLRFVQGDCAALPLEDASVDLVVSFETLEHHDRHDEMMREIRRVLRPGGLLVISSPNRLVYDTTFTAPNPYHVKGLDEEEFRSLLKAHFREVALYAQRVTWGSVIVSGDAGDGGFATLGIDGLRSGLERSVYFLALAGDVPLPSLGSSLYEGSWTKGAQASNQQCESRVYIAEHTETGTSSYSEARGAALLYPVDGQRQRLELRLPEDLEPLLRMRLDIATAPVAVYLHALSLVQVDGVLLWQWPGGCEAFLQPLGVICLPDEGGVLLLCVNDDPQFDLDIPAEVLAQVRGGAVLRVEMTPYPVVDVLPQLAQRLQARIARPPAVQAAALPVGFAGQMEELAGLLQTHIQRKNAMIAVQREEIEALRKRQQQLYEQVVRAEAQLDLLKEIALGNRLERL